MHDVVKHRVKCKKFTVALVLFTLILGAQIATKTYGIIYPYCQSTVLVETNVKTKIAELAETANSDIRDTVSRENITKYIFISSDIKISPMTFFYNGQSSFLINNCNNTNCYITNNIKYLNDNILNFDAVLFNGKTITKEHLNELLPVRRSPKQKYVFGATESAHYYPITPSIFKEYFNWTWTYKLDSDLKWNYFTIYDLNGEVVGPSIDMKWPEMKPVSDKVKARLKHKRRAVAWIVSRCKTVGQRHIVASKLEQELAQLYLRVNVYGKCGILKKCLYGNCDKVLQNDFYFYLAFENSIAEDYVTEKLLVALNNYVVPIVYGGADYSRFLPPGSYIRATMNNAKEVAAQIFYLIMNRTAYEDYFRWRNHFVYKKTQYDSGLCEICNALHDEQKSNKVSVQRDLLSWWNVNKSLRMDLQ